MENTGVAYIYFDALNYAAINLPGLLRAARAVGIDIQPYKNNPEAAAHRLSGRIRSFEKRARIPSHILW